MPEESKKTAGSYELSIKRKLKKLGTYRPEHAEIIRRTAELYVQAEKLEEQYKKSGGNAVITHTNKHGEKNLVKNPLLAARNDVYSQLLAHERELGLTPAALRKLTDGVGKKPKKSTLEMALEKVGSG